MALGFLEANRQLIFDGAVNGLVYGMLAMGIVLVFRSSRVINFAAGNMGLPGAGLLALLALRWDVPFWVAALAAITVGALFAAVVEIGVVRRLFTAPRVILLVATIGIAQLAQGILLAYPDVGGGIGTRYPVIVDTTLTDVAGLFVTGPQLSALIVAPLVAIGLGLLLDRTPYGRTVQATAANPDLSRVSGIKPKRVSLTIWVIAGVVSTIAVILLSADRSVSGLETVGLTTMANSLAAAAIARMRSFPLALAGGVVVGVTFSLVKFNYPVEGGLFEFVRLIGVLVAVAVQGRRDDDAPGRYSFAPKVRPIPQHLMSIWWVRHLGKLALGMAGVAAVMLPIVVSTPSRQITYATILAFGICAVSVAIITGWAGQLSLGQMAFAGIGAVAAASFQRGIQMDIGWGDNRLIDFKAGGIPFAAAVALGAVIATGFAGLVGVGALRVRGLLLAVATFVLALATEEYLFRRPIFSDGNTNSVSFRRGQVFGLDLDSQRTYYWLLLGVLVVVLVAVARIHRNRFGRAIRALRDNADAAAAYGVRPARTKLGAFTLAGAVAGLGGGLLAGVIHEVPLTGRFFGTGESLRLISMAIIGGIGATIGPVLGALWVIGLPAFAPTNRLIPLFTSGVGLLILLLYFPSGLAQIAYSARDRIVARLEARRPPPPAKQTHSVPAALAVLAAVPYTSEPALRATGIAVRFGGRLAVDNAHIEVAPGEVVGLIGTNGAGKSTLINAIGGFVPSKGRVELYGRPIHRLKPAERSRHGLGRTFQAATLFPELTVRETVLVAASSAPTHGSKQLVTANQTRRGRRSAQTQADDLIDFLGLGRYADRQIADLSTGTRRIVELAGLLALNAQMLCLDEPAAGVAQREAEAFGPLIVEIRRHLNAAMLIVEHDMPLIMSISDRVYCLEAGSVIAQGTPGEVRTNPAVITSYLGLDPRAIHRSDATLN
ncbi:ABC transporter permease subunit [Candidatus Poriferisocius sp.]|uniref:ABC transporter permease subunit n=1 Tax=Candidatus Poriferisocius sp. TaxID=3101276 RepID=UPI003B01FB57